MAPQICFLGSPLRPTELCLVPCPPLCRMCFRLCLALTRTMVPTTPYQHHCVGDTIVIGLARPNTRASVLWPGDSVSIGYAPTVSQSQTYSINIVPRHILQYSVRNLHLFSRYLLGGPRHTFIQYVAPAIHLFSKWPPPYIYLVGCPRHTRVTTIDRMDKGVSVMNNIHIFS